MALSFDRVHLFALLPDFSSLQGDGLGYNLEHSCHHNGFLRAVVPQKVPTENGTLEASIELRSK